MIEAYNIFFLISGGLPPGFAQKDCGSGLPFSSTNPPIVSNVPRLNVLIAELNIEHEDPQEPSEIISKLFGSNSNESFLDLSKNSKFLENIQTVSANCEMVNDIVQHHDTLP